MHPLHTMYLHTCAPATLGSHKKAARLSNLRMRRVVAFCKGDQGGTCCELSTPPSAAGAQGTAGCATPPASESAPAAAGAEAGGGAGALGPPSIWMATA